MKDFEHRPLNTNSSEIRLLRITKAKEDDPIVLELKHAILDDRLVFNALSYTWGDETPLYDITVRDGSTEASFSVRGNLNAFLKTARKSSDDWSREWIWIDQVCINQRDHAERCHQVAQMGTLYSTAQFTMIWPEDLSRPSNDHKSFLPFFSPEELYAIQSTPIKLFEKPEEIPSESAMRLLENCTFAMLKNLMETPYWTRIWIFQEVVLASQPRVLIEDGVWDFDDFQLVVAILGNHIEHHELEIGRHQITNCSVT